MQNSITTKPNKVNHEISRLKGATATAVSGGGGGGFNEYKYNLSFQNLIQLKSIILLPFDTICVRLSSKIWLPRDGTSGTN